MERVTISVSTYQMSVCKLDGIRNIADRRRNEQGDFRSRMITHVNLC